MEKEIWKPIKNYEGSYEVSNMGKVRSLDRYCIQKNNFSDKYNHIYRGKILNQYENSLNRAGLQVFDLTTDAGKDAAVNYMIDESLKTHMQLTNLIMTMQLNIKERLCSVI